MGHPKPLRHAVVMTLPLLLHRPGLMAPIEHTNIRVQLEHILLKHHSDDLGKIWKYMETKMERIRKKDDFDHPLRDLRSQRHCFFPAGHDTAVDPDLHGQI